MVVQSQIRNVGSETIHILADRGMPYQIARDAHTLLILQGINKREPDAIYEMSGRCEVGWGATATRPEQMSLDDVFAWQRIEGYGPVDVVLP